MERDWLKKKFKKSRSMNELKSYMHKDEDISIQKIDQNHYKKIGIAVILLYIYSK
jgi:hypothetical protein